MRTRRIRNCAVLLILPLIPLTASESLAVDVATGSLDLTAQQNKFKQALNSEFQDFLKEHPEYLAPANEAEALRQRRDAGMLWQQRARLLRERILSIEEPVSSASRTEAIWKRAVIQAGTTSLFPNEGVSNPGPPDQNNASFSFSEVLPFEAYGVWTEHLSGLYGTPPTWVFFSGTPAAGSGTPWPAILPPTPIAPTVFPESWNPTMAASLPLGPDMYFMTMAEWLPPALGPGAPSVIVTNTSVGAGLPFPSGSGPAIVWQAVYPNWADYPYLVVNEHPGNPGPPGLGDVHVAWVEYIDADGADADGNGIWYDDVFDQHNIWVASANQGAGPFPYPAFGNYNLLIGPLPTAQGQHQAHRPSLSVVGPPGTPLIPLGGVYIAWFATIGSIAVDASPAPGLGAPWGAIGPIPAVTVNPLPPSLNGGFKTASSVSIAVDNGPLFGGMVYLAWSDYATGDADILFSVSADGGFSWQAPVRVNQDKLANGADQWAPHMMVDIKTGEIKITYYDRRCDAANLDIQTFASTSMDGGVTWTDWLVSDAGPTPPATVLTAGGLRYIGDYLHSDFNTISGYGSVWNDGRNGGDQDVLFDTTQILAYTGDPNDDGVVTSSDLIYLVNHVFKGGSAPVPCWTAGDVNCDGVLTSSDIIYLVNFVFKGGAPPCDVCQVFPYPPNWSCP